MNCNRKQWCLRQGRDGLKSKCTSAGLLLSSKSIPSNLQQTGRAFLWISVILKFARFWFPPWVGIKLLKRRRCGRFELRWGSHNEELELATENPIFSDNQPYLHYWNSDSPKHQNPMIGEKNWNRVRSSLPLLRFLNSSILPKHEGEIDNTKVNQGVIKSFCWHDLDSGVTNYIFGEYWGLDENNIKWRALG